MSDAKRIAVIGAGPAGFYAAEALSKKSRDKLHIDIIERLPAPNGLVRYGVAPDHEKIKRVRMVFAKIADRDDVHFIGNAALGRDFSVDDLRRHYHQIVYAFGSPTDRKLWIPGAELAGSLSATEFVAWYNGHPDYVDLAPDLSCTSVAVIGVGNVALDVARILVRDLDELKQTDIADHAIEALANSRVRDVYVFGRRGPAQAKFTNPEIREFGELAGVDAIVRTEDVTLDALSQAAVDADRTTRRNVEILTEYSQRESGGAGRRVFFSFFRSPVELLGEGAVQQIRVERTRIEAKEGGGQRVVGTGEFETHDVGMVLRSIGYRGEPHDGVPFDDDTGTVENAGGRVTRSGVPVPGEYVAGWAKRGPTGVVGTNKGDAIETVERMLEDTDVLHPAGAQLPDFRVTLRSRGVRTVDFAGWSRIDAHEIAAGEAAGRPRVKSVSVSEMLSLAGIE